jgi:predicted alpha/beta-fold hydrolase
MPALKSNYRSPFLLSNGLLQTIIPGSLVKTMRSPYQRERILLSDGDFLDLDWYTSGRSKLIISTHGLEGSSLSGYNLQLLEACKESEFDFLAWNCRSCSGEMNRTSKLYHHADIEDIRLVVRHVIENYNYEKLFLTGYSMGGCISIKYLSEDSDARTFISACVAASTPCDIALATEAMDYLSNRIFRTHFLHNLKSKLRIKMHDFPDEANIRSLDNVNNWSEFDKNVIAPFNGYKSSADFHLDASANTYLHKLKTPTLLINALNDPILQKGALPSESSSSNPNLYIELPKSGGHAYFPTNWKLRSYLPKRMLIFFREQAQLSGN